MNIDFSQVGDPIVIVSHPRSGTHLTIDLIRKQFATCASYKYPLEPQHYLYLSIEGFLDHRRGRGLTEKEALKIIKRPGRPIIKFHTYSYDHLKEKFPQWMDWIERKGKMIFVRRHVNDVLRSYYVYAQSFESNASVPIGQFIQQSYCGRKNRVVYWSEVIESWSLVPDILTLDYNDLIKDTRGALGRIGDYIKEKPIFREPLLPNKVDSIWRFRWDRLAAMRPESTSILGSRRGEAGLQKELTEDDKAFIAANAGDTLDRFYPKFTNANIDLGI